MIAAKLRLFYKPALSIASPWVSDNRCTGSPVATDSMAAEGAADPAALVVAATETYVKITGQGDQGFKAAGEQLDQELDTDKTIAMWKSHAEGSGDSSVSEGRSAVYRWAASKMGEDAKFEDVAASVAAALKNDPASN